MNMIETEDLRTMLYSIARQVDKNAIFKYYIFGENEYVESELEYNSDMYATVNLMKNSTIVRKAIDENQKAIITVNNGIIFLMYKNSESKYVVDNSQVLLNYILLNMIDSKEKVRINYFDRKGNIIYKKYVNISNTKCYSFFMGNIEDKVYEDVKMLSDKIFDDIKYGGYKKVSIENGKDKFSFSLKEFR